jgi:hypothetical protein
MHVVGESIYHAQRQPPARAIRRSPRATSMQQTAVMGSGAVIWLVVSIGVVVIFVATFLQRRRRRRY